MEALFFHPKVVHIPMALGVLMPLLAGGLLLAWWRNWLPPRAWVAAIILQAILVGSGAIALQSGEAEEERVEQVVAEQYIEEHEEAAKVFVLASAGVLAVMILAGAFRRQSYGLPIAVVATLGTVLVFALGYRTGSAGGSLVYEHGAAQAVVGPGPTLGQPLADGLPEEDD